MQRNKFREIKRNRRKISNSIFHRWNTNNVVSVFLELIIQIVNILFLICFHLNGIFLYDINKKSIIILYSCYNCYNFLIYTYISFFLFLE